ncbi:MAG TPA: alpha/beta fold hydrolase [Steroidobacter sp.]|uniref:alpha/beta fold hydrolase n=1 Tax=Steroidobacter sp. TaxID=1978227 RepID=UPI002ED83085
MNIGTLSSARRVIALDLPGHGRSSKSVGTGGLTELARGLFALLDQLEIDKAHLVGHSMGGALAMHVAREHRARVQSLTLAAPLGLGENIDRDFIESFVTAQSRRELQRVVGKLFRDKSLIGAEMLEGLQRYKRIDGVSEALATIAGALFSGGRQQVRFDPNMLDGIPTLVIWGSADEVLDSSQAPAPRANLRVEIFDDVGHVPHLEAAGTFNRLVAEHVAASER